MGKAVIARVKAKSDVGWSALSAESTALMLDKVPNQLNVPVTSNPSSTTI